MCTVCSSLNDSDGVAWHLFLFSSHDSFLSLLRMIIRHVQHTHTHSDKTMRIGSPFLCGMLPSLFLAKQQRFCSIVARWSVVYVVPPITMIRRPLTSFSSIHKTEKKSTSCLGTVVASGKSPSRRSARQWLCQKTTPKICVYSGVFLSPKEMTMEHIIPQRIFSRHRKKEAHHPFNIAPCGLYLNQMRSDFALGDIREIPSSLWTTHGDSRTGEAVDIDRGGRPPIVSSSFLSPGDLEPIFAVPSKATIDGSVENEEEFVPSSLSSKSSVLVAWKSRRHRTFFPSPEWADWGLLARSVLGMIEVYPWLENYLDEIVFQGDENLLERWASESPPREFERKRNQILFPARKQ